MRSTRFITTLGVMVVVALLVVSAVGPAASHGGRWLGAKLTTNTQPSNSSSGINCGNEPTVAEPCTFVMREALGYSGNRRHETKAPRNGVIKKIKLIASTAGSFRLQIAKIKPGTMKAKIVRNGPRINYLGQPDPNAPYLIETFKVNIPIRKGQSLAVKTKRLRAMRCNSGGAATLTFQKPLKVGGKFRQTSGTEGCFMLIRAILK